MEVQPQMARSDGTQDSQTVTAAIRTARTSGEVGVDTEWTTAPVLVHYRPFVRYHLISDVHCLQ